MDSSIDFYRPFKEETFDDESCFLCGKYCNKKTAEHIFPKWLQRKYDLWNQKLIISNRTSIPYRNLTVPCCTDCNNIHLSIMENCFRNLLNNSFENLSYDDELIIFQWTAKILYATRYKELSLLFDRKNPNLGKILSPFQIEGYTSLHLFLQSIRIPTIFKDPKPWSLFVMNCDDKEFFYQNDIDSLCLTMKFGEVAITIVYEDNNMVEQFMHGFKKIGDFRLSFAQYIEVNANIFYSSKMKLNVPKYITMKPNSENQLTVITLGQLRSKKWVDKEYASLFDYMLLGCGIDLGKSVLNRDGNISTFLIDENDEHITRKLFGK